jgi:hypothetical protein
MLGAVKSFFLDVRDISLFDFMIPRQSHERKLSREFSFQIMEPEMFLTSTQEGALDTKN